MNRFNTVLALLLCLAFIPVMAYALTPPSAPVPPPAEAYPVLRAPLTPVEAAVVGSVGEALTQPDQTVISLQDKIVTGNFYDPSEQSFYIEEDDRSAGIRVITSFAVAPGDRVTINAGTLCTMHGERCLISVSAVKLSSGNPVPGALAMDNRTVGGAALNGYAPGIKDAVGAYNKGLLITTWGRVTFVDSINGFFYVDDGSGLCDGTIVDVTQMSGIRVRGNISTYPSGQQYVVITGISSSFIQNSTTQRQIRVRGDSDITPAQVTTVSCPPNTLKQAPAGQVWWSFIGLPGVPIDSAPTSVFANTTQFMPGQALVDNITRWEPTGDQDYYPYPYVTFPSSGVYKRDGGNRVRVSVPFGCMYSGQGYWIRNSDAPGSEAEGAINYQGIMEPIQSTDRYIPLPRKRLTCIGNPFDHAVLFQSVLVTDGKSVLPLMEAAEKGWVSPYGYWWSNWNQGLNWLEAELWWADPTQICMRPWQGYWIVSEKDNVAMIVKHDGQESIDLTANPSTVTGGRSSQITARLTLRSGHPMVGATVNFSTTAGTLSASDGVTDPNGMVSISLSGVPLGQTATVTATSAYSCSPMMDQVQITDNTQTYVQVSANPSRIAPDGASTTTISVHVTDQAQVPLANAQVALSADAGTLSASVATTDSQGLAQVTLTSSPSPTTAAVVAACSNATAQVLVDFADADDPYIRILSPQDGDELPGVVPVLVTAKDTGPNGMIDLSAVKVYLDGTAVGMAQVVTEGDDPSNPNTRCLDTRLFPNGLHTLRAAVTDPDGNTMYSQQIDVGVHNTISQLRLSQTELLVGAGDPGVIELTAQMEEAGTWSVAILDRNGNTVHSNFGTGPGPVYLLWDGKTGGAYINGIYTLAFSCSLDEPAAMGGSVITTPPWPITISAPGGRCLITGMIRSEENEDLRDLAIDEMLAVMDACEVQGIPYTIVADPQWKTGYSSYTQANRRGMEDWLRMSYRYWFHIGHGTFLECDDGVYRARTTFDDGDVMGNDYWVPPGLRQSQWAFSDLNLPALQYEIVHLNSCFSAGSWTKYLDGSIAQAFGIGDYSEGQTYVGWGYFYWQKDSWIPVIGVPDGADWTRGFWQYLGQGHTVDRAVQNVLLRYWDYDGIQHNFLVLYGDPYMTWLTDY